MFANLIPSFKIRTLSVFIVSYVLVFCFASCATERSPLGTFPAVSNKSNQSVVAISVKPFALNTNIDEPVSGVGKGALTGAGMAAGAWGTGLAGTADPYATVLYVAILPVAVITGAITGAVAAHPETEVIEAITTVKTALSEEKPTEEIQREIVNSLSSLSGSRVRTRLLSESEMNMSPDQLADVGIDTLLLVEISHLDLMIYGKIDPDAALTMTIRASVTMTDTMESTPPSSWTYAGKRHDFFELAKDDAYLLRETIKKSYKEIANVLVSDYF